jgi:hypothetical protein
MAMTQWAMEVGHGPWHDGPHIKLGSLFVHLFYVMNYHWSSSARSITLCRSIIVSCGIVNILRNIPMFSLNVRIFSRILSVPHNIVMDLNNVMRVHGLNCILGGMYSLSDFVAISWNVEYLMSMAHELVC